MTSALATAPSSLVDAGLIERVLLHGDLRQLNPAQKVSYYKAVCDSVGLNPLTQPFQYLVLNGKEILYATRAATEQLRTVHAVSVQIMAREVVEDCYVVTARAILPTGRQDENIGAVPIAGLKGEARANAMMKAETKAKRRVTLAICGLGMLDETEVASIPGATGYATPISQSAINSGAPTTSAVPFDPHATSVPFDQAGYVDTTTGEETPLPPGFYRIDGYSFRNGWHDFRLLNFDDQGGSLKLSTKKDIGYQVEQAAAAGLPIKVKTTPKKNSPGEAYLDAVTVYQPAPPVAPQVAVPDDSIPF